MTYVLYERRDTPIFSPVMALLALALADNAFKDSGIKMPENLFSLTVPDFKGSLAIQLVRWIIRGWPRTDELENGY